jgi:hypothetical protein
MAEILQYETPHFERRKRSVSLPLLLYLLALVIFVWQVIALITERESLIDRTHVDLAAWQDAELIRRQWFRDRLAQIPVTTPEPPVPIPTQLDALRNHAITGTRGLAVLVDFGLLIALMQLPWTRAPSKVINLLAVAAIAFAFISIATCILCMAPAIGQSFESASGESNLCELAWIVLATAILLTSPTLRRDKELETSPLNDRDWPLTSAKAVDLAIQQQLPLILGIAIATGLEPVSHAVLLGGLVYWIGLRLAEGIYILSPRALVLVRWGFLGIVPFSLFVFVLVERFFRSINS